MRWILGWSLACGTGPAGGASGGAVDVGALETALAGPAFRDGAATLVDVRTPEEFAAGHVPGAKNVPVGELAGRLGELDPTVETWVICEAGGRSAAAARQLRTAGYTAVDVTGGMQAWRAAGGPTE
jgi:rhodanese-related sulfurtransferase